MTTPFFFFNIMLQPGVNEKNIFISVGIVIALCILGKCFCIFYYIGAL